MPANKRIFVAVKVELPNDQQLLLNNIRERLAHEKVRWVPLENMHITLCFLGNCTSEQLASLKMELKNIAGTMEAVLLTADGLTVFPSERNPKVITSLVLDTGILTAIHNDLRTLAHRNEYEISDKAFKPHITLGRVKQVKHRDKFLEVIRMVSAGFQFNIEMNKITLFESVLTQQAPIYKVLSEYALNPSGPQNG